MPGRRFVRKLRRPIVLLIAAAMCLQSATPAWAWGRTGHRVIAKFAERHLTERAKAEIKALLEPGESLADCSTWADEVRGQMRHTAPWHQPRLSSDSAHPESIVLSAPPWASMGGLGEGGVEVLDCLVDGLEGLRAGG